MMEEKKLLESLGLLDIDGFEFVEILGGGSALSSLYIKENEKVVFKFLILPRNPIELERFKLEFSVLEKNRLNSTRTKNGFELYENAFTGPKNSYPLPTIKIPLASRLNNLVNYFAYSYEEGNLLSDLDKCDYSIKDKISLLHRLASGLNYFNQTGYSHRDLHPENILLLDEYNMPKFDGYINDPGIKFLDMGNCQRTNLEGDWLDRIDRDLDEDAVFQDNNRRILASFISMPPDFLDKGEDTENYDTWSFGIYAYDLLFGEMPFYAKQIGDVTDLLKKRIFADNYNSNLESLPLGLNLILRHLLSPTGSDRPSIDSIVRLFSWLMYNEDRFQDHDFIKKVIHGDGFDPYHDPIDDYY